MKWLLSKITNNPAVLGYAVLAAFLSGLASGGSGAWWLQGLRLDSLQGKFDTFVSETKAAGVKAEADKKLQEAADRRAKEDADEQRKKLIADNLSLGKQLQHKRTSRGILPQTSPVSSHPERICFKRPELDAAIRRLDDGVQSLITKGDDFRIGLNVGRLWCADIKSNAVTQ